MTTQPWESEFDEKWLSEIGFQDTYKEGVSPTKIKSFITSTRLSAYKEGQRDMREEVVKMIEWGFTIGDNEVVNQKRKYN